MYTQCGKASVVRKFINSNSKAGTIYFKITQERQSRSKEIQLEFPRQNKVDLKGGIHKQH